MLILASYLKSQKESNFYLNFSTASTNANAFLELVDFWGHILITYHSILVVKEVVQCVQLSQCESQCKGT